MNRLAVLGLALWLGACTTIPTSLDIATATSRNTLYGIVSAYGVALSAENTYKGLCIQGSADKNCRANVVKMQAADVKAVASITAANNFMKTYPTVDATNVIQAATDAVNAFKVATGAQ